MSLLRSERAAAIALVIAAVLGLSIANSPVGTAVVDFSHAHVGIPGTVWDLSLTHWVADGLLAVFFLVAAIELRHELTQGSLRSPARAALPAIAAAGGVLVPIGIYLIVTAGSGQEHGWPVPTATDIAFALGILALVGRGLPTGLRAFLLALAILDDIVAILIIAIGFTADVQFGALALAAAGVVVFGALGVLLQRRMRRDGVPTTRGRAGTVALTIALVVVGFAVWSATLASGVHATIAGVALGLALAPGPAHVVRHTLEPVVNGGILPIFAFSASLVIIPSVPISELQPVFWAIVIALPVGKLIGIGGFAWIADRVLNRQPRARMSFADLLAAGALGGIGFTVSLLMAGLAFAGDSILIAEATLAVLLGSSISIVLAIIIVGRQSAYYRRLRRLRAQALAARTTR
jgi:NhaA family Na+:H+ antiporter